jgi:hypothetical protein
MKMKTEEEQKEDMEAVKLLTVSKLADAGQAVGDHFRETEISAYAFAKGFAQGLAQIAVTSQEILGEENSSLGSLFRHELLKELQVGVEND